MKKYLLLATTAMFMAGNAMAGSIATDGRSATIGVTAKLEEAASIIEVNDMDFKTMISGNVNISGDLVRMDTSGTITKISEDIISFSEDGTKGEIQVDYFTQISGIDITCAATGVDISANTNNKCYLNENNEMYIKKVTMQQGTSGWYSFGATLGLEENGGEQDIQNVQAIKVTLQY